MRFVQALSLSRKAPTFCFLTAVVLFYLVGILTARGLIALDLPLLQLWSTPAVLAILGLLSIKGYRIPRLLIAVCALFLLGTFLSARVFISPREYVLLARLPGDSADAETRIFREKLNASLLQVGDRSVEPLYSDIKDAKEAAQFLEDHPNVEMLLWGTQRWLNISFAEEPPFELSPATASAGFLNFYGFKLVNMVSQGGVPYQPEPATLMFLSRLITGYTSLRRYAASTDQESAQEQKAILIAAAKHRDLWPVRWHRALAVLKAANYEFAELLQLPSYDHNKMSKVMELYYLGLAITKPRENPQLFAALSNNLAVASFIDSQLRANKKARKRALKLLRVVLSFGRHPGTKEAYGPTWTLVNDTLERIKPPSTKKMSGNSKKARRKKDGHGRNHTEATSPRASRDAS